VTDQPPLINQELCNNTNGYNNQGIKLLPYNECSYTVIQKDMHYTKPEVDRA